MLAKIDRVATLCRKNELLSAQAKKLAAPGEGLDELGRPEVLVDVECRQGQEDPGSGDADASRFRHHQIARACVAPCSGATGNR